MLRTIEEIRRLKIEGKYKWGKDLIIFLTPYFESGRSNEEVISILSSKYEIDLDLNELKNLKFRYGKVYKPPEPKMLKTSDPQGKYTVEKPEKMDSIEIGQKQEKDIEENLAKREKIDISKMDFRTPTPKPTFENWKK